MAMSSLKAARNNGFTLIEVLVALAIVAIAMTAIIKATSQNIRATGYLEQKTMALWAGQEILTKARLNLIKLSDNAVDTRNNLTMLNQTWYWQAEQEKTPNPRIKKITVRVFANEETETSMINLSSYVYYAP